MSATLHTKSAGDAPDDTAKLLRASVEMERLRKALQWFVMLQRAEGEDANDQFERVAEAFHKDTGYLRPGKDCRLHDTEVRQAAWDAWVRRHVDDARAALAKAQGGAA